MRQLSIEYVNFARLPLANGQVEMASAHCAMYAVRKSKHIHMHHLKGLNQADYLTLSPQANGQWPKYVSFNLLGKANIFPPLRTHLPGDEMETWQHPKMTGLFAQIIQFPCECINRNGKMRDTHTLTIGFRRMMRKLIVKVQDSCRHLRRCTLHRLCLCVACQRTCYK